LLLWSLFLAVWLTLYWVILPHIDDWRPRIERLAGQAVGLKLSIGSIHVRSSGWVPALELRDLRLFDREDRVALRLERVHTALSMQSLLGLRLRFEQVLIDSAVINGGCTRGDRGDGMVKPVRGHQRSPRPKPANPAIGGGRVVPAMARSMVRMRPNRSRICACTVMSSAETGSSQTSSRGSTARARAIATRWRCPPES
jgi:hypothetical protein